MGNRSEMETHGEVLKRLEQLQQAIAQWATPLRDPAPLRWAVVELIDIVKQMARRER